MTGTLIFLAIGMFLFAILLAALLLREQTETSHAAEHEKSGESQTILTALELNLPSRLLAYRIFAQEDCEFVSRVAPLLRRAFLQERKIVALLWLKETRACRARIFHFYRIAVRGNSALEFATELRIAGNYFMFLFMIATARGLIYLLGPFRVRGLIMLVFGTGERVSFAVGRTLANLEPSSLARIKADWARQSKAAA